MITDEMVKLAWAIAVTGRPVGAGDGCGTVTVEPPTLANMRAAIETVAPLIRAAAAPMIRAAALEEARKVAFFAPVGAYRDYPGQCHESIAAAIRAMKEEGHD